MGGWRGDPGICEYEAAQFKRYWQIWRTDRSRYTPEQWSTIYSRWKAFKITNCGKKHFP